MEDTTFMLVILILFVLFFIYFDMRINHMKKELLYHYQMLEESIGSIGSFQQTKEEYKTYGSKKLYENFIPTTEEQRNGLQTLSSIPWGLVYPFDTSNDSLAAPFQNYNF